MMDGGFRDRCCADVDGFLMIPLCTRSVNRDADLILMLDYNYGSFKCKHFMIEEIERFGSRTKLFSVARKASQIVNINTKLPHYKQTNVNAKSLCNCNEDLCTCLHTPQDDKQSVQ